MKLNIINRYKNQVEREDGLWNIIGKKGKILSPKWFLYISEFYNGFAEVQREDELWNHINEQGEIVSKQWFRAVGSFCANSACVQREDGQWNYIDEDGNLLSNLWFDTIFRNTYQKLICITKTKRYYVGKYFKLHDLLI